MSECRDFLILGFVLLTLSYVAESWLSWAYALMALASFVTSIILSTKDE